MIQPIYHIFFYTFFDASTIQTIFHLQLSKPLPSGWYPIFSQIPLHKLKSPESDWYILSLLIHLVKAMPVGNRSSVPFQDNIICSLIHLYKSNTNRLIHHIFLSINNLSSEANTIRFTISSLLQTLFKVSIKSSSKLTRVKFVHRKMQNCTSNEQLKIIYFRFLYDKILTVQRFLSLENIA